MPVLTVGNTDIPYEVRFSDRASRKRIIVTPDNVEVVAPVGTPMDGANGVHSYVTLKRRWVFNSVIEINAQHRKLLTQHYASGAKLQYRGRWLMLVVIPAAVEHVEIRCRSKLELIVPEALDPEARGPAIKVAFDTWLRNRAQGDLSRFCRRHERALGVTSTDNRLCDSKGSWGTCAKDGVIRVNWRLIQAPAAAMEYVVAHEVAHLVHRNHEPEFWRLLAQTMPDWEERKRMLERWEGEHRAV